MWWVWKCWSCSISGDKIKNLQVLSALPNSCSLFWWDSIQDLWAGLFLFVKESQQESQWLSQMMGWTTKLGLKAASARLVEMTAYQIDGPHLFELLLIKQRSADKMVSTENVLPASDFWAMTLVLIHSPEECRRGRFRGNKSFKLLAVVRKFPFPTVAVS